MRLSTITAGAHVPFPEFTGERIYMQPFDNGKLPVGLERWQPTVDAMLNGRRSRAYLMVDQKVVHQNAHHRRPGLHVDGVWNPALYAHGHGGHGAPRRPRHSGWSFNGSQTLILASDHIGCVGYDGWYDALPSDGGDCAHIDVGNLSRVYLSPFTAYYGDAITMLHESVPASYNQQRTVVRINVED